MPLLPPIAAYGACTGEHGNAPRGIRRSLVDSEEIRHIILGHPRIEHASRVADAGADRSDPRQVNRSSSLIEYYCLSVGARFADPLENRTSLPDQQQPL